MIAHFSRIALLCLGGLVAGLPAAGEARAATLTSSLRPHVRPWPGRGDPEPVIPDDYNLPSTCLKHLSVDTQGRGLFYLEGGCLDDRGVDTSRLPHACLLDIDIIGQGQDVYSTPCLLDRGYVMGY